MKIFFKSFFLLIIVWVFLMPLSVHGQVGKMGKMGEIKGVGSTPVDIYALILEYNKQENVYIARGQVEIKEGLRKLTADYVRYNKETEDVYAEGNVIFQDQGDVVHSEKMYLNLFDKKGTIEKGRIFIKQGNFNVTGDQIKKVGENEYAITNGEFTTCDLEKPAWKFSARDIGITVNGYGKTKGTRFYILDYPVFYLPYGAFPVKTERQSGLLMPELVTSSRDGIKIKQSYYWAISKDKDATFFTHYIQNRGFMFGGEFRYALREDLKGGWQAQIISDRDYNGTRYQIKGRHEQVIGQDFTFKTNIDYVSDKDFIKDFAPTVVLRSENVLKSTAYVEKPFAKSLMTVEAAYFRNLIVRDNDRTFQYLPHATFFTESIPVMKGRFFIDLQTNLTAFTRPAGDTFTRLGLEPRIRVPYSWKGVNFLLSSTFYETAYLINRRDTEGSTTKNRQTLKLEGDANIQLMRNYQAGFLKLGEMQSVIKPQLKYTFVPNSSPSDIPYADPYDRISQTNAVTYSFSHYLNVFTPSAVRELSIFEIEQTYGLSGPLPSAVAYNSLGVQQQLTGLSGYTAYGTLPATTSSGSRFSDVNARLTLHPLKDLSYTNQTAWNVSGLGLTTMRNTFAYTKQKSYFINLTHNYTQGLANETLFIVGGQYKMFEGRMYMRYSFKDQDWIDTLYQLVYRPKCWALTLTLVQSKRPNDTTFRIGIDLAGITTNQLGGGTP
ncbi:MAG: hypothetical protein C0392_12910 [Syntrophus sp. (in: bacteria)]|nr:hypothetical protein [Syntrophus sp. (in: bacteria)]